MNILAHNIKCLKKVVGSTVLKFNFHTSEISVQILQCTLSWKSGGKGKEFSSRFLPVHFKACENY